jgi:hypothetical protein
MMMMMMTTTMTMTTTTTIMISTTTAMTTTIMKLQRCSTDLVRYPLAESLKFRTFPYSDGDHIRL